MRVAIFTESYEPVVNGVSVAVATLRDGLRARGHDVVVYAPRFAGYQDTDGVFRFPSWLSRFAPGYPVAIPYAPRLRRAFFRQRPDIVHTQTPFLLGAVGLRWARGAGVPIVSTNHTLYTEYTHYLPIVPKALTRAALVQVMRWYYARCDAIVVPSHAAETVLRQYGVRTPIEIIKSGVGIGPSDSREEIRDSFGISNHAFLLLYVGRVAREKNLGLLLRAFKTVRESHPDARLMIVGSGPHEQASLNLARALGIGDGVTFAGMLGREKVARVYSAADAFVFPSVTETQGLVICEALTAGLPCIAVRAAGTPEVVEEGVDSLLTGDSVEEFAQSVSRLISDPGLRQRLSQGALRNAAKFTKEGMTERFEAFYQSAIERKRA
jgi:glycosyltransferase involved in cell wall biosynthesis